MLSSGLSSIENKSNQIEGFYEGFCLKGQIWSFPFEVKQKSTRKVS